MTKIQVVYASRHGGTAGIARRIAEVLRAEGVDAAVVDAADRPDPAGFDGYVVGSGVYLGSWLKPGIDFLEQHQATLATRPVWLFSSGPLPGSSKDTGQDDPLTLALGPAEGIGSGGHKRIATLYFLTSIRYGFAGDWGRVMYWVCAAGVTIAATWFVRY